MKNIGIIDADLLDNGTRHPNLACLKLSAYHKQLGNKVTLLENYDNLENYDLITLSRVFTFTKVSPRIFVDNINHDGEPKFERFLKENIVVGGTGFYKENAPDLPSEIEHIMPDYHLYDDYINKKIVSGEPRSRYSDYLDYSIGFTTRGCFRKCDFCVNKKYDKVFKHSPVSEFLDPSRKGIYLWDDNFMASADFESILDEIESTGKSFQFRQGLDIRLMTEKKALRLSKAKYHGDFIFAFDHVEDKQLISDKLDIWRKFTKKSTKLYVLTAYASQDEVDIKNTFERIKILMEHGCLPYIMRYQDYKDSPFKGMYIQLARWCNQPQFIKKQSFRQYCENNEIYHQKTTKNSLKKCACYTVMKNFEEQFPEIAYEYFDLRMEEINKYNRKE